MHGCDTKNNRCMTELHMFGVKTRICLCSKQVSRKGIILSCHERMASVAGLVIPEKCRWNASEFFHRPRRWTRLSSTELAIAFRAPVGPSDRAEIPCCWPECLSICDNDCAVEADTNPLYGWLSVMNTGWLSTVFPMQPQFCSCTVTMWQRGVVLHL